MADSLKRSESTGIKEIIVISKGDWGVPNPSLMKELIPVDLKAVSLPQYHPYWGLLKGQEYKFTGDAKKLYDAKGLKKLFDVKGAK